LLDSYMSLFTMYKSRSVQCETTDFLIEILWTSLYFGKREQFHKFQNIVTKMN
jgi:hypothetical protein